MNQKNIFYKDNFVCKKHVLILFYFIKNLNLRLLFLNMIKFFIWIKKVFLKN